MVYEAKVIPVLSYSTPEARESRARKAWRRVPLWVIALALLAPVMALEYSGVRWEVRWLSRTVDLVLFILYFAAMAIPGALRRLRGRQVLVMLGCAGGAWLAVYALGPLARLPFVWILVLWAAAPVLLIAAGEGLLARPRSWRTLACVVLTGAAAVFLFPVIRQPIEYAGITVAIPQLDGWEHEARLDWLIHYPLLGMLTWIAIPLGLRLASSDRRRRITIAAGFALASLAVFLFCFHFALYVIARWSLVRGEPFDPVEAFVLLGQRGRPADVEAMWQALAEHDWPNLTKPRDAQDLCLAYLLERDAEKTAQRLSGLLHQRPSAELAEYCASVLADHRRFETAPFLMRYVLSNPYHRDPNNPGCEASLQAMGLPMEAIRIIRDASVRDRTELAGTDFPVSPENREWLIARLGQDAGPALSAWIARVDASIRTALPPDAAAETVRIFRAHASSWNADGRLHYAKCRVIADRLERGNLPAGHLDILRQYDQPPFKAICVPPLNCNAADTAALEREAERYVREVDAMVRSLGDPNDPNHPNLLPPPPASR